MESVGSGIGKGGDRMLVRELS